MATANEVLFTRQPSHTRSFLATGMGIGWVIALAKFLLHLYFNNGYGYFRDEFDYMACGITLHGDMWISRPSSPF